MDFPMKFPECFGKLWTDKMPECRGGRSLLTMQTHVRCMLYDSCATAQGHTVVVQIRRKNKEAN